MVVFCRFLVEGLVVLNIIVYCWTQEIDNFEEIRELADSRKHQDEAEVQEKSLRAAVSRHVTFCLFTNGNALQSQILEMDDRSSLERTLFNPSHPTRIIVHGWKGNSSSLVNLALKSSYFSTGYYNIIVVDYSYYASQSYVLAASKARRIGEYVGEFINFLCDSGYIKDVRNLHLIGHSLGGHICGFAARNVRGGQVGVIHALDPAKPYFDRLSEKSKLRREDAEYVQVISTNTASYGYDEPLGHVTFYPGFGKTQPACKDNDLCSHVLCVSYFAEAILKPQSFVGLQCRNVEDILERDFCAFTGTKIFMGPEVQPIRCYGVYYVPVRPTAPYGYGDYNLG